MQDTPNIPIPVKNVSLKKLVTRMILWFLLSIFGVISVFSVFKYQIDAGGFTLFLLWGGLLLAAVGQIMGLIAFIKLIIFLLKNK